jgi:diguanylate cyclase (GGDEF)-like protein
VDRQVARSLHHLLQRGSLSARGGNAAVNRLGKTYGKGAVCAELVFQLTRRRVESDEALSHWSRILAHTEGLSARWGYAVDLRVGLLNYFLDFERRPREGAVSEIASVERESASVLRDNTPGIVSPQFFLEHLRSELNRSLRANTPVSFIVADVDDLGRMNDSLGRAGGDVVLALLSRLLRRTVPMGHLIARSGGGEFVILLPATSKMEAARIAEDVREAVAAHRFEAPREAASPVVTLSLGVSTCPADAREEQALMAAGDCALYEAKQDGKNRVCLFRASTRSFARRKVAWRGTVRPIAAPAFPMETIEIGEGGLLFRADRRVEVGALLEVVLPIDDDEVRFAGRVVWSGTADLGTFEIAIQFVEQRPAHLARVTRRLGLRRAAA